MQALRLSATLGLRINLRQSSSLGGQCSTYMRHTRGTPIAPYYHTFCSPSPIHHGCFMSFYSTASKLKQTVQEDVATKHDKITPSVSQSNQQQTVTPTDSLSHAPSKKDVIAADVKQTGLIRGVFQRFKEAYKEYGKTLVAVHCVTSSVWFGSFYYAAATGIDFDQLLHMVGASEHFIEQLTSSGLGNVAAAYLMYKLATPARYTVTIVGTQLTVKCMRKLGYMAPVPEGDSLRELFHEGKSEMSVKYQNKREEVKGKMDELKGKADEMRDDMKERIKDRASDIRDDFSFKRKNMKDGIEDKATEIKPSTEEELKDNAKELKSESYELKSHSKSDAKQ